MRERILVRGSSCWPASVLRSSTRNRRGTAGARLEGDWVRIDPDGVGSFDGLSGVVPAAQLLPGSAGGGRGGGAADAGAPTNQPGRIPKAFPTSSSRSRAAAAGAVAETAACSSTRIRAACTSSSRRTK